MLGQILKVEGGKEMADIADSSVMAHFINLTGQWGDHIFS